MKKKLLAMLITGICILPIACGFATIYIHAGFVLGCNLATKLAKYMEAL